MIRTDLERIGEWRQDLAGACPACDSLQRAAEPTVPCHPWRGLACALRPEFPEKLDAARQECGHRGDHDSGCPNVPTHPARISRFGSQRPITHGSSRGRLAFQACSGLPPGARISALLWRPGNRFPEGGPKSTSRRYGSPWSHADHGGSLPRRYSVSRASRTRPTCCPTQQFLIGSSTPEVRWRMFAADNEDRESGIPAPLGLMMGTPCPAIRGQRYGSRLRQALILMTKGPATAPLSIFPFQ